MINAEELMKVLRAPEEEKWNLMLFLFCDYFAPIIMDDECERAFLKKVGLALRQARQQYAADMETTRTA